MIEIQEGLADGTRIFGWKSDPPLTPFAPSYAHYFTEKKIFSSEECEKWNTYLLEQEPILLDKYKNSQANDGQTGLGNTSITSRYGCFNLLKFDFDLVPKLKKAIYDGVHTLLRVSNNTDWQETLYANSWFNVLRQGESINEHSHGFHKHSFYGFNLHITDSKTKNFYYHPIKFQRAAFYMSNKIGHLTLFPNFIPHSVSPNKNETPRISIAGDIRTSSWKDDKEFKNINKDLVVKICS